MASNLNALSQEFETAWQGRTTKRKAYIINLTAGYKKVSVQVSGSRGTENKIFQRMLDEIKKEKIGNADFSNIHVTSVLGKF